MKKEKKEINLYNYIKNTKLLINENIHIFLFGLIKEIFLVKEKKFTTFNASNNLKFLIEKINNKMIIKNEDFLSCEYNTNNFKNILNFVKKQNNLYAGEILENILIIVFSYAFKAKKEDAFGKYLYNNLGKIKSSDNSDFKEWFQINKFQPEELKNIDDLLKNDFTKEDEEKKLLYEMQKKRVLYNFLLDIYEEKYCNKKKFDIKNKFKSFIYGSNIQDLNNGNIKNNDNTMLDKYITVSQYSNINTCMFYKNEIGKSKKIPIRIIRSFFISVYIYYQNKHSPLMKYRNEVRDEENNLLLSSIPFSYDLTGAVIEKEYSGIILSPTRIEQRINEIILSQNILKENGLMELSKVLLFNKNIKSIDFNTSALKSNHINFLNNGLGLFDNYNLEQLNISYNYLKDDSEEFLARILSHLKGLKTIILTSNDLKRGISSFLIILKKLYRQKKINLENLFLNKCALDDMAFYELGELLKSKYCKLKTLCLNMNNIPSNVNFIKKLKKNRSLTEIYFNKDNVGDKDSDNTMRFMSYSNIECLYLYNNKFNDFNDCLRLIYRTKLITTKEEEKAKIDQNMRSDSNLNNLDISSNDYLNKNKDKIKLLDKCFKETTLYCLDLSHILYGPDPNKIFRKFKIENYKKNEYEKLVEKLKARLDKDQENYEITIGEILSNEVDKEEISNLKRDNNKFKNFENEIIEIIKEKNAKYPIFLKEKAKKLISENKHIFDINNSFECQDFKNIENELFDYMIYKRASEKLKKLIKKKREKKLIII